MTTLYCPHCKTNVLVRREEINWCLVIILAIFTAGIGILIYFIIYFNNPENRCVHCNSICRLEGIKESTTQLITNPYHVGSQVQVVQLYEQENEEGANYCLNCGVKLERVGKFCPYCGTNVE
ncbi:MAG: hypothetical protein ACFFBP_05915 [Promethearchaeota archaeon]